MAFPERFSNLPAYAFPRLRALLDSHPPGGEPVAMSIGEPKHAFPAWIQDILVAHMSEFNAYPPNDGSPELLSNIAAWIAWRYGVCVNPLTDILSLNGTREGLYNAAMALCPEAKAGQPPLVLLPNPFYQVYLAATFSVAAQPHLVTARAANGFLPDYASLSPDVLNRTAIAYICSPSNPQGAVASPAYLKSLIELAETYDFKIFADECYSEIYRKGAPSGALQIANQIGADPERVVVFHSLSKRSNLPGLRSGFAASGPQTIARMKHLRAYSGAPLPLPLQRVAEAVWADEQHVIENRGLYQEKFDIADALFGSVPGYISPEAGFFLWLPVEDGEQAALKLWRETGIRVLPGAYLARDTPDGNPGHGFIRVALVAPKSITEQALTRLHACLYT